MKLKALDTMFVSAVKPDSILPNEEFEVSDEVGADFVKRGLATEVSGSKTKQKSDEPVAAKTDEPPLNKMDAAPSNKANKPKKTKSKKGR